MESLVGIDPATTKWGNTSLVNSWSSTTTLGSFVGIDPATTEKGKYCDELLVRSNNVTLDSFVGIDPATTKKERDLCGELLVEYNNTGEFLRHRSLVNSWSSTTTLGGGGGGRRVVGIDPATTKKERYLYGELLVEYNNTEEFCRHR